MYKSLFISTLFLLLVCSFSGQAQKFQTLTGTVIDSVTNEPLSFASVKLEQGGKLITGVQSTDDGGFKIETSTNEVYIIKIEYVGYAPKSIEINATENSVNLNLGALGLAPLSQLLETLIVTGIKPNMVTTLEKQIFDSEQFEVAKGGTAADLIKNIPSVMVNVEGEISVRGSKGFVIMVNGKPSALDQATILSQIPANTIQKVEIISVPSARYEADGRSGILNIVTKKGAMDGLSVFANMQYGLPRIKAYFNDTEPKRQGVDATVSYRKEKLELNIGVNYLQNDIAGRRVGDAFTIINDVKTIFPSEGERSFIRESYGLRTNATYNLNANNELTAGVYLGSREQYRTANIVYNNTKVDATSGEAISAFSYYNGNQVLKAGDFQVYNLDYLHKFEDQSSISVSGLMENAQLDGNTKNRNLNQFDYSDTLQYTYNTGENPLNALRLKVDYEKPIKIGVLAFGYQYRLQNQDGVFRYLERGGNNLPFVQNDAFSADIRVENRIHGLYGMYSAKFDKLEFSSGLRYEKSDRVFKDGISDDFHLDLSNFFPSANIMYSLSNDWRLKAGYSRRVQRSTNNELNPYPEREHSETLEQGDPRIKPEFIGITEVGISKDAQKLSVYMNLYHQHITDIVNRVNSVYNDTILNRIYTNAGVANLVGSELGLTWAASKKLKWFVGGNVYRLNIDGTLFENAVKVDSRGWVYSLNSNLSYKITPSLSSQFNFSYMSARNTAQGEDSRFYQPNLSVKKSFMDNKLTVGAQWQNMAFGNMGVNQQRITTFGTDFFTTTNYIQETNIVLLNLSFNFNQRDGKVKLPSSEFGEKEF
ncbi:outer membrane beta-barrel family protein [Arcticibacterium luteifluviistationis]|uniref:TonB-dependent receptor n=1 Tax=Arcticibacterium luteifluviistationis TaxID=1784714 RepID=A0A2Z4GGT2_9BACT|nr:outer membrane beta-barrel family protein [Arcticibacterium luteifluviistationis]AWW00256.1 TonB-dependent receptor [Arcticibacterium luteifluviistationis]